MMRSFLHSVASSNVLERLFLSSPPSNSPPAIQNKSPMNLSLAATSKVTDLTIIGSDALPPLG